MQHDLIGHLWRVDRVPFAPVVADRVGEHVATPVEIGAADRAPHLRVALQAVFGVFVPKVERAVGAGGAERAVLWVEADGVDAVDVADIARVGWRLPVALEAEVGARVFLLHVLDRAPSFDAAHREPCRVGEARHHAGLPF